MKRMTFIILLFILVSLLVAETFTKTYRFEMPKLVVENGLTEMIYENCKNIGDEGDPLLPKYAADILLSQTEELVSITILSTEYYPTRENVRIKPAGKPFPLSVNPIDYEIVLDPEIYNSSNSYPALKIADESTNFLSGHSIASFTICPVDYIPSENSVSFMKEITLEISSRTDNRASESQRFLKKSNHIKNRINRLVDNPEKLNSYSYPLNERDENYDILLITNDALLPSFSEYISFKESTGFYVLTETTEDIYANYTGGDEQEKIRNCVIDLYENHHISFLILGGDSAPNYEPHNIIPHRGFYADAGYQDFDIPADMYYSCLDGNWNDDGDNRWGEQNEADLLHELSVGRLCVDNAAEVENFTHKLMMYQNAPVIEDIEKSLMLGEKLWDDPMPDGTYAAPYKNEVADGSSNNGYTTVGVSENFNINRIYEQDYFWPISDVFNEFNNIGINLLNHLGHSSTHYNMKMDTSDITTNNFQNDGISRGFVVGYSQGCYAGAFDNRGTNEGEYYTEDSFAEKLTALETGEAAFVCNSRYGWGEIGGTNGASQYFDRQFFDAIFAENITNIGIANDDSKEDNIAYINAEGVIRWTAYELILFGDPSMDIWTAEPTDLYVNYPSVVTLGTANLSFETDIENARIGIVNNGELIGSGITDISGSLEIELAEPLTEPATLEISVIAHNKNRHIGQIQVIESEEAFLAIGEIIIDDSNGNDNGMIDHGEEILLNIGLQNYGMQPATDIEITVATESEYILNNANSTSEYDDISADSSSFNLSNLSFDVSDFCPDNTQIPFHLTINSTSGNWEYDFSLTAFAPELNIDSCYLNDENENGYLEPGESVEIDFTLFNDGNGISENIIGVLQSYEEFISITQTTSEISSLSNQESQSFEDNFTFVISEECPSNHYFNLYLMISDELGYYDLLPIELNVGFYDDVEHGENNWMHYTLNEGSDQWHQSENRFFSDSHSWKAGGNGDTDYYDNLLCTLESDEFEIETDLYFSFYHWMAAESSSSYEGYCYDGGLVEIYYNDEWQQIFPVDGYPLMTRGENNPPFPMDTQVFSGEINWKREYFDLSDFYGNIKLRFVFGSDGGVSAEGWYIDDLTFVTPDAMLVAPSDLTAELGNDTGDFILLNWEAPDDEPLSYKIYRKTSSHSVYEFYEETSETTYEDYDTHTSYYHYYVVSAIYDEGESPFSNSVEMYWEFVSTEENEAGILVTNLAQNYPNPFNPTTTISFSMDPKNVSNAEINIYNIRGQKIKSFSNLQSSKSTNQYIIWDGKDEQGKVVGSGIYFYNLRINNKDFATKKCLLLK